MKCQNGLSVVFFRIGDSEIHSAETLPARIVLAEILNALIGPSSFSVPGDVITEPHVRIWCQIQRKNIFFRRDRPAPDALQRDFHRYIFFPLNRNPDRGIPTEVDALFSEPDHTGIFHYLGFLNPFPRIFSLPSVRAVFKIAVRKKFSIDLDVVDAHGETSALPGVPAEFEKEPAIRIGRE